MSDDKPLSFEQIQNMRAAIGMVLRLLGDDARRRPEVASAIVPLAGIDGHSAATLANLALEKMGSSHFVLGEGEQTAG